MPDIPCRYGINCRTRRDSDRPCRFVHPDEPQWNQAQSKDRRDRSIDGSTRSSTAAATSTNKTVIPEGVSRWNPSGASKSGGSTDKSDKNPSSAWNFSGHKPQSSTSSVSGDAWTSSSNLWGDWDSPDKGREKESKSSSTTGWGNGAGWGDSGVGWGNINSNPSETPAENTERSALSKNADDAPNTNSWAGDKANDWSSGTGWDGPSSSWNFGGGNDKRRSSWSGDKENHTNDKGKRKMTDDVSMSASSPQRKTSFSVNSPQQQKVLGSDLPHLQPTVEFPQNAPESARYAPLSSASTAPLPMVRSSMSPSSTDFSGKLKMAALEATKRDPSQDKLKAPKCRGPAGRKTLYTQTVKHLFNAVWFFTELQAQQDDLDRWRRTQNSSIYGHATLQTRKILDSKKSFLTQRVQETKVQFQREVNILINLPVIGTSSRKMTGNHLTKEVIAAYTQELQAWFEDLQLHKRLLVEMAEGSEKAEERERSAQGDQETEDGEIKEQDQQITEQDLQPTVTELRKRVKVTWKELTEVTEILEQRFKASQEDFYMNTSTHIQDQMEGNLSDLSMHLDSDEPEEPAENMDICVISQSVEETGKKVEEHADTLATFLERAETLERKLETLRLERKESELISHLANQYFADFEKETASLTVKIAEMTEQMRSLYLHKPSSLSGATTVIVTPQSTSPLPSSQPEPIDVPDLLESIRPLVRETLRHEFGPIANILRQRCADQQQQLKEKIDVEAGKILTQVRGIKTKFGLNKLLSLSPIPQAQLVAPRVVLPPLTIPTIPPS